jgi:hypothetical protein
VTVSSLVVDGLVVPGVELAVWQVTDLESKQLTAESPYVNGVWELSGVYSGGQPVFKARQLRLLCRETTDSPEQVLSDRLGQWAGRSLQISLPGHEQGYFKGTAQVGEPVFEAHRVTYTIRLACYPWYLDWRDTVVEVTATKEGAPFKLPACRFTTAPRVTTEGAVVIKVGGQSWSVPKLAGRELVNLVVSPAAPIDGTVAGSGLVRFTWQGGVLL